MFKFLKKTKKKDQYKCKACGSVSNESSECCGSSKDKLCSCGCGKYVGECCCEPKA